MTALLKTRRVAAGYARVDAESVVVVRVHIVTEKALDKACSGDLGTVLHVGVGYPEHRHEGEARGNA